MKRTAEIYLDRSDGPADLTELVRSTTDGFIPTRVVKGPVINVGITRNTEKVETENFLSFPIVLEIDPADDTVSDEAVIDAVATLGTALGDAGYSYVSVADFEDVLPSQGRNVGLDEAPSGQPDDRS